MTAGGERFCADQIVHAVTSPTVVHLLLDVCSVCGVDDQRPHHSLAGRTHVLVPIGNAGFIMCLVFLDKLDVMG